MGEHSDLIRCRDYILDALKPVMRQRSQHDDWVEREQIVVAVAANNWATANGWLGCVTREHVERIETSALGHVDYASKLCLYVAEYVVSRSKVSPGAATGADNG